jgi:hypothetical protein
LAERHEGQERAAKGAGIETDGAFEDDKRQKDHDPEEPRRADDQEKPKRPAAMRSEIAGHRIAQRHAGEQPDEDGV